MQDKEPFVIAALYKFTAFAEFESFQEGIKNAMLHHAVKGTILIAHEGINGTIAGTKTGIESVLAYLSSIEAIGDFSYKLSYADAMPFYRTKVKLKKEIVTMGIEDIDPLTCVGQYVKPKDWNALISDPEVLVVDTRNDYEVQIGSFKNAVNPKTETFRQLPDYIETHFDKTKHKKVAMFCTGGIRCEKSTAYMKQQGFEAVYHLEGGILQYLEDVPKAESMWEGECFVFDNRVSVNHDLEVGQYDQCYACRMPITEADKHSPHYVKGASCHHCFDKTSATQKQRYHDRQAQMQFAKVHGIHHIGGAVTEEIAQRKAAKKAHRAKQAQLAPHHAHKVR